MKKPVTLKCCKPWRTGVPPTWLVVVAAFTVQVSCCGNLVCVQCRLPPAWALASPFPSSSQIGFGLYPVIVKKYAAKQNANPLIFSFYRCALIHEQAHILCLANTSPHHSTAHTSYCLLCITVLYTATAFGVYVCP